MSLPTGELLHPPPLEGLGYRQGHSTPGVHGKGWVGWKEFTNGNIKKGGAQGRTWEELLVSGRCDVRISCVSPKGWEREV